MVYLDEATNIDDTIPIYEHCDQGTLYDIPPHSEVLMARGLLWDGFSKAIPKESVHIYVTYADTLQKYGTCEVLKKRIFEKTYNITYEDAKRMNWRIVFDGK